MRSWTWLSQTQRRDRPLYSIASHRARRRGEEAKCRISGLALPAAEWLVAGAPSMGGTEIACTHRPTRLLGGNAPVRLPISGRGSGPLEPDAPLPDQAE